MPKPSHRRLAFCIPDASDPMKATISLDGLSLPHGRVEGNVRMR